MGYGLYEYQLDAIRHMKNGCILNGGVGSGKSRTALGYYCLKNGNDIFSDNPSFMVHPLNLYIITTAKKRDSLEWEGDMTPFLLSSNQKDNVYDNIVVVDSWNNIGKYEQVKSAFFIFDEQRIVGNGAWVKSFYKIAKNNQWILLSATPGDSYLDYIPVFVANGFYRNRTEFLRTHVVYSNYTKFPKVERYFGVERLNRLRRSILVDMDFHRKTQAYNEDVFVSYDVRKYKDVMKYRWNIWDDKPIENASGLCYALRRVINSDESRGVAVLEIFEKHPRVIIFYNFTYELEILKNLYYGENVEIAEWNGRKHQPIPTCDSWVYLVQYNACEGWSCITTDTIIFYSQSYSYKTLEQAKGRIDRMNTPYPNMYYYHIRSRSGIDLAITKALTQKKQFNESAFVRWKSGK